MHEHTYAHQNTLITMGEHRVYSKIAYVRGTGKETYRSKLKFEIFDFIIHRPDKTIKSQISNFEL